MKLLVTGATGYLGRRVVDAALSRGHHVRAIVRPSSPWRPPDRPENARLETARLDLRQPEGLSEAMRDVDAIIHLAAAKTGSFYQQMGGTVVATENLLAAQAEANVRRLVLISSFSVYDYQALRSGSLLDENAPLEAEPTRRDDYCRTKLLQEQLTRRWAHKHEADLRVLRPGVIYGEGHWWTDRIGVQIAGRWVGIGSHARLPLTHVRNCAQAILLAAEADNAAGQTFNIVDDELPTQRQFRRAIAPLVSPQPRAIIPVNWTLMRTTCAILHGLNRLFCRGRAKFPQIFRPASLHARCKPLRYTNQRLKQVLSYDPPIAWREATQKPGRNASADQPTPRLHEQPVS